MQLLRAAAERTLSHEWLKHWDAVVRLLKLAGNKNVRYLVEILEVKHSYPNDLLRVTIEELFYEILGILRNVVEFCVVE